MGGASGWYNPLTNPARIEEKAEVNRQWMSLQILLILNRASPRCERECKFERAVFRSRPGTH